MFTENKANAKYNLQGRVLKSFFIIFGSHLSFLIFLLSSFFCLYLLIINTDFLGSLGVFENQYIHAMICAFAVIENFTLLMFHIYLKLRKDVYFYLFDEKIRISASIVFKAFNIYTLKTIKKIFLFFTFTFPFTVVAVLMFFLLQNGISYLTLITFSACDAVLLIVGLYTFAVYIQKYQLLPFVLIQNRNENIREIFALSAKKMNGMCKNLMILKIRNLPKNLLCILIIPSFYYLPYCRAVESDFVLEKEKPYMRRKAYTEKPIVFYFNPVKEN